MNDDRPDETRFAALLACALVISCFIPCTPAEVEGQREDPALDHARACVGEVGWSAPEACQAIVEVHVRRGARVGIRPELVARAYSAALRRPPRGRAWVPQLTIGRRPSAWPDGPSWRRHERLFAEVLAVVRATLAGERVEVCPEATHYGGLMDARPRGHREVCRWDVVRGAQLFYAPGEGDPS